MGTHWSLRLRGGDPTVLDDYEQRGRIHGGTIEEMEADIIDAWRQARRRGETVALMANDNDTVGRLNRLAQHTRITAGELDGVTERLGGCAVDAGRRRGSDSPQRQELAH